MIKSAIVRDGKRRCLLGHLHVDCRPPTVMKKAAPYQPTLSRPLNSSVILGIAVATIV
jgi:hypothetical protein